MPPDEQPHRPAGDRGGGKGDTVMKTELTLNVLQTMNAQEYGVSGLPEVMNAVS
ncbi:hypothetical protein ACLB1T_00740 [Escherichia coli]